MVCLMLDWSYEGHHALSGDLADVQGASRALGLGVGCTDLQEALACNLDGTRCMYLAHVLGCRKIKCSGLVMVPVLVCMYYQQM